MRKVPAILTDIDGVLLRGRGFIPRSDKAMRYLRQPLKDLNQKLFQDADRPLPLIAVTNGGGKLEVDRAKELNKILGLTGSQELQGHNVVLNFSPLRLVLRDYKDKVILISGIADIERIALDCGVHKFVTISEYCALYPSLVPISLRRPEDRALVLEQVKERMQIYDDKFFEEPFQINAIFFLNDPVVWEESIQVTMDLVTTADGRIADKFPKQAPDQHIPIYAVNNDFLYSDTFRLPRLAFGPFTESLKRVYEVLHKRKLSVELFGKPEKATFEYASTYMLTNDKLNADLLQSSRNDVEATVGHSD